MIPGTGRLGLGIGTLASMVLLAIVSLVAPNLSAAQAVSASEREALLAQQAEKGGRAEDVDVLIRLANEAAVKGLPVEPLTSKIREGVSKKADPKRIELVIRQMTVDLDAADQIVRELQPAPVADRAAAVTLLAESLAGGVTSSEVRELGRQAQQSGKPAVTPGSLASAAKGLSFIKDAKLPVSEGTAVVAEAVRQGFRTHEVLDLGREIKRRERDYQAGRASLRALREAIARGDRPDQLFRHARGDSPERPATTRPDTSVERPERPNRPELPERPERPVRTGR